MSAILKFKGSISLQLQGSGPVYLLIAQCSHDMHLRGLARWHEDQELTSGLGELFKDTRLVITIDQQAPADRYQGVVPLEGANLAQCLEAYFRRSEQLNTRLWLAADCTAAAGLLLQAMPESPDVDAWQHVTVLADTLRVDELLALPAQTLLRRLYHEDDLRLFEPVPVSFRCTCSRERTEMTLKSLGEMEVRDILAERGNVDVTCEFCARAYHFDKVDVASLFSTQEQMPSSTTRH